MAKTKYTKDEIVAFIRDLDVRAKTLSDTKIDNIIDRGYAELTTVSKRLFSNEDVIPLDEYYDNGELKVALDIEDDVTEIYDIYVTEETDTKTFSQETIQGVGIYRNNDVAFRDNRYLGRFHLDLTVEYVADVIFDNCVVKYYYTPKATNDDVFMDSQVYLAFQDAMWAALNYFMKDIEGESQKRASMTRTSQSTTQEPEDIPTEGRAMFGGFYYGN